MKRHRARVSLRKWSYPLVASGLVLAGCDFLGNSSADAGTSGGSGVVLSSTCSTTFTACGGDLTGTWDLTSICAETNPTDKVNAVNAQKFPDCGNVCSAASMTASGSVKYLAQTMSSGLAFRMVESLSLNPACFAEAKGTTLTDSTCQSLGSDPNTASSCALVLSNCNCQYDETTTDTSTSYAVTGSNILEYDTTALSQQTVEYCVAGTTMTQRRNMTPGINYVISFTRRL